MLYGWAHTDKGEGIVTDFICDHDGLPAQTIKSYLWEHGLDDQCSKAINVFWAFLFERAIIVRDPDPYNICLAQSKDGELTAYLVDGYGRSNFLPLVEWFPAMTRKKLTKRRARFDRSIQRILELVEAERPMTGKGAVRR